MKKIERNKNISAMGHAIMNFSVSLADLILLNLLFILFSLPLVTIPSSMTAMNTIAYRFAKGLSLNTNYTGKNKQEKKDFEGLTKLFKAFKHIAFSEFRRSLIAGLLVYLVEGLCVYILLHIDPKGLGVVIAAFAIISLAATMIFGSYMFTMFGLLDIPTTQIVKNSIILLFENLAQNVLAAAIIFIIFVIAFVLFPFSMPFIFCIHFSLSAYLVQRRIQSGIDKCIIDSEE